MYQWPCGSSFGCTSISTSTPIGRVRDAEHRITHAESHGSHVMNV